jgi:hypothetical protein
MKTVGLEHARLETCINDAQRERVLITRDGKPGVLKVRPDGTILDGHHRIMILRDRGVDVNELPREIVPKDPSD